MRYSSAPPDRLFSPSVDLRTVAVGALSRKPRDGPLDPLHRAVLAQCGERFEDPRGDRRAGDRNPDRLVELTRLHAALGEDPPERVLELRRLERLRLSQGAQGLLEQG